MTPHSPGIAKLLNKQWRCTKAITSMEISRKPGSDIDRGKIMSTVPMLGKTGWYGGVEMRHAIGGLFDVGRRHRYQVPGWGLLEATSYVWGCELRGMHIERQRADLTAPANTSVERARGFRCRSASGEKQCGRVPERQWELVLKKTVPQQGHLHSIITSAGVSLACPLTS
ncbi:hypothetical protein EX30DRAFT_241664 [Ascodesmis nigricans]|uniref:Uncharacterized protein n=1 Tax=Ascodesmis nigricans TaxID=341454 RepID=A0A4S2MZ02_9PEZI|nr:hypothetical protein EX30DRAFT_241664 [Ascodesmis nigricans]